MKPRSESESGPGWLFWMNPKLSASGGGGGGRQAPGKAPGQADALQKR